MTDALRASVVDLAAGWLPGYYSRADRVELALAVAAMVAEECAQECEHIARAQVGASANRARAAFDCAAAIRQRAKGLR